MQEFKVGDRFSVEGVVTALADCEGDYRALFDGHHSDGYVIGAEMAHAKLIEPAVKAAEEKVLDLSKPVRRKNGLTEVSIIGPMSDGRIVCEYPLFGTPQYAAYYDRELENIPESKITTSDVLSLWKFHAGARAFMWGNDVGSATRISSQVRVSYTEGEGWSIEEVK